jgi:hypothetical protein
LEDRGGAKLDTDLFSFALRVENDRIFMLVNLSRLGRNIILKYRSSAFLPFHSLLLSLYCPYFPYSLLLFFDNTCFSYLSDLLFPLGR